MPVTVKIIGEEEDLQCLILSILGEEDYTEVPDTLVLFYLYNQHVRHPRMKMLMPEAKR